MIKLYLVRHAIAVSHGTAGYQDDDRPLTEEGIEKMTAAAKGIFELIPQIDVIITSPLKRAYDTAKIIAKETNYKQELDTTKTLLPGCTAKNLINYLVKYKDKENLMVVGHEPDFGMIAASLIGDGSAVIELKKGALCKIELDSIPTKQPGRLVLLLQPKILRMLGKK
ncbi:MAG: phosphohistidine phosphatase SixA [Elusimicrobiota bacterium]|nr:phosphohistidine phosphatase SixA [Elusimicrobiota bacterium]